MDTQLVETHNGYRLEPPTGASFGVLDAPWARDAAGKSIPTSYAWHENVLTQIVDLSDRTISYPVLIDPAWGYSLASNIGYQFVAAPGHVDGAGSNIAFEFYKNRGGQNRLSVSAHVINDFGLLNGGYVLGASNTWFKAPPGRDIEER